jgi:ubiquinone/menaquinone biosynthesis C-methylase UbiE
MNFNYVVNYNSPLLRGNDDPATPRPWNLEKEILTYADSNKTLLDIGCGSSIKLPSLAPYFHKIFAIDISQDMITSSKKILSDNQITNTSLIIARNEALPFLNNTFDVVTCMLARCTPSETYRTIKPTGVLIVEYPGCEDKKEFKKLFGKDKDGWRGQFINFTQEQFINYFYESYHQYFKHVEIKNGFWDTYYTKQGLLELLKYTPTVKDFDLNKDQQALELAYELFKTPQGIRLRQNRILVYATNY